MYFFSMKKLKEHLIEKPMTDKETLPYLIGTLLLWELALLIPQNFDLLGIVTIAISLGSTILGSIWLFRKNGGESGNQFLHRYFAIGWVALIRFITVSFPIIVLAYAIGGYLKLIPVDTKSTSVFEVLMSAIISICFYLYSGKHIAEVAKNAKY